MTSVLGLLTAWDYLLFAVVFTSVLFGLLKGFVRTVFGLAAWFVAALAALLFGPALLQVIGEVLPLPFFMFLVFLAVFLITRVVGNLVARGLAWVGLGGVDRVLGGLFGGLRAGLIMVIVVLGASMLELQRDPAWERAWSRPILDEILSRFGHLVPDVMPAARRALDA
jgi:membrane protein required for colicin V production